MLEVWKKLVQRFVRDLENWKKFFKKGKVIKLLKFFSMLLRTLSDSEAAHLLVYKCGPRKRKHH